LNQPTAAVYNLTAGHREFTSTTDDKTRFQTTLPAGGWNVYVCADAALQGLDVVRQEATLQVRTLTDEKKRFDAAVPLEITLQGANGESFVYTAATDHGKAELTLPVDELEFNVEQIIVQELLTGQHVKLSI
jgi:hypothetical protein